MKLAMRWQRGSEMLRLKDSMLTSKDSKPKLRLLLIDEFIILIDFYMDYSSSNRELIMDTISPD